MDTPNGSITTAETQLYTDGSTPTNGIASANAQHSDLANDNTGPQHNMELSLSGSALSYDKEELPVESSGYASTAKDNEEQESVCLIHSNIITASSADELPQANIQCQGNSLEPPKTRERVSESKTPSNLTSDMVLTVNHSTTPPNEALTLPVMFPASVDAVDENNASQGTKIPEHTTQIGFMDAKASNPRHENEGFLDTENNKAECDAYDNDNFGGEEMTMMSRVKLFVAQPSLEREELCEEDK